MMSKALIFFVLFCFLTILVSAQDGITNKKDDIEFANGLVRLGYQDLAAEMAGYISRYNPNNTLRCSLLSAGAQQEYDVDKREEKYQQAISCYQQIVKTLSGLSKLKTQKELADLLVNRAHEIIEQNEEIKDPQIFSNAENMLNSAQEIFEEVKSRTDWAGYNLEVTKKTSKEKNRAENAALRYEVTYGICRAHYFLGLCGSTDDLNTCLEKLEEYIWDYEGLAGAYYAMLLRGLVFHELGKFKEAITFYEGVYRPLYDLEDPLAQELVLQASYYNIKTLVKWNQLTQALQFAEDFRQHLQKNFGQVLAKEPSYGQGIILEEGKAYVEQGDYNKAIEIAQKIGSEKTYWGFLAKRYLLQWGKLNPESLKNAKNAHLIATGFWSKDQHAEAILAFQNVLQYSKTSEEMENYGLDSWEKLGQIFWLLNLHQEAAIAYKSASQKYKEFNQSENAAKAAYWSYRGYRNSYKITKSEEDKENSEQMRNYLVRNWKNSAFAYNLSFTQAEDWEKRAEEEEDKVKAAKLYVQAAKAYRSVHPRADLYERALVNVGKCYYNAAKQLSQKEGFWKKKPGTFRYPEKIIAYYKQAINQLLRYHSFARTSSTQDMEEREARRKEAMAQSYFYLGRSYLRLNSYSYGMKALTTLYRDYPEQNEMVAGAFFLMIKLEAEAKNITKAEQLVTEMEKRYGTEKGSSITTDNYKSFCYYLLGDIYSEEASDIEDEIKELIDEDPLANKEDIEELEKDYLAAFGKSVRYLEKWIEHRQGVNADGIEWVASKLAVLGQKFIEDGDEKKAREYFAEASKFFQKCLSIYEDPNRADFKDPEKVKELQLKLAECSVYTENWENAIYVFYPIFHEDKKERKAQRLKEVESRGNSTPQTRKESNLYLNNVAKVLCGLAQKKSYEDPKKLFRFLMKHAHHDFTYDLEESFTPKTSARGMFDKYLSFHETISWMKSGLFSDEDKKQLERKFQEELDKRKGLSREEMRQGDVQKLQFVYRNLYRDMIVQNFPENSEAINLSNVSPSLLNTQIKRLSLYLAYDFTSNLVNRLPRYKDTRADFGEYTNTDWWEAKYRQVLIVYLRGDSKQAADLISSLMAQQRKMGGKDYKKKFDALRKKAS